MTFHSWLASVPNTSMGHLLAPSPCILKKIFDRTPAFLREFGNVIWLKCHVIWRNFAGDASCRGHVARCARWTIQTFAIRLIAAGGTFSTVTDTTSNLASKPSSCHRSPFCYCFHWCSLKVPNRRPLKNDGDILQDCAWHWWHARVIGANARFASDIPRTSLSVHHLRDPPNRRWHSILFAVASMPRHVPNATYMSRTARGPIWFIAAEGTFSTLIFWIMKYILACILLRGSA